MKRFLFQSQWSWIPGGIVLGTVFILAILLVKPIGVSTQFVILDGILWDSVDSSIVVENSDNKSGYSSSNAYLDKSGGKYAKSVENPINYSFIFVIAMIIGGFLASKISDTKQTNEELTAPAVWRTNWGDNPAKRYLAAFLGGILVLIGARLAGGCTSGHMMSGMIQTSISGYIFALGVFLVAIPLARTIYKRG